MRLQPRSRLTPPALPVIAEIIATLMLLSPIPAAGQELDNIHRITRPDAIRMESRRLRAPMDGAAAFRSSRKSSPPQGNERREGLRRSRETNTLQSNRWSNRLVKLDSVLGLQSFGTGGGDIDEIEPNDPVAQGVALPVNVTGEIGVDRDVDFFAFRALADQQITIEAFAARVVGSELFADIALFESSGELIDRSVGDADDDPLIRYTAERDEILIAGIADADDLGGPRADYVLNVTRGVDVDEVEPNGVTPQVIGRVPATAFGSITGVSDVDFYRFAGIAGQTLIVDVDAEILGSTLDPEINLLDPVTGVQYFYNDQRDGDDSRFNIMLPYTGVFIIGIDSFEERSQGFYRLNISLVPGDDAPLISGLVRLAKKSLEVRGRGFNSSAVVEVNGIARQTFILDSGTVRAKVKIRSGDVVTISNGPDERRSNPLIF
ncbi:MAG TPA: PPC domain-containing protein [Blastocatellia bacterium]|nr:PPC domain-containing protein [Blastocatellia bacterium]